jgi:hypothetical protein
VDSLAGQFRADTASASVHLLPYLEQQPLYDAIKAWGSDRFPHFSALPPIPGLRRRSMENSLATTTCTAWAMAAGPTNSILGARRIKLPREECSTERIQRAWPPALMAQATRSR